MSKRRRQGKKNESVVKVVTLPTDPEHERRIDALIEERAAERDSRNCERDEEPELRATERDEQGELPVESLPVIETTGTLETAVLKYLEGSSEFDAMLPTVSA